VNWINGRFDPAATARQRELEGNRTGADVFDRTMRYGEIPRLLVMIQGHIEIIV
jgi:hypothetical protein